MLKEVNLNLIQVFCLIYEERGIGRAADVLNLSQPTVSYSLKQLRRVYSDQLFHRERGELIPSARAQQIYPDLRAALDLIAATEISKSGFTPENSTREFVLMLSDLGELVFLPKIQRFFGLHCPGGRLRVEPLEVSKVAEKLATGEIDAAIQTPQVHLQEIERTIISHDKYVIIARKDHPRIQGDINLEQLKEEKFIRVNSSTGHDEPEFVLSRLGVHLQSGLTSTRVASVPGVVMGTDLLGIIPHAVVRSLELLDKIQAFPIPATIDDMEVSLLARVKSRRTAAQNWFVDCISDNVGDC